MPERRIVQGQRVSEAKTWLARELRRNMTPAERRLWAALRRNQLAGLHFRRSQIIDGFVADFFCNAAGLVVEVDGPIHDEHQEYDAERDHVIAARNLHVLRVTNDEVFRDLPAILGRIIAESRAAMADAEPGRRLARRWSPPSGEAPPSLRGKGDGGLG